jgi:ABC-2 type transport system permease protein
MKSSYRKIFNDLWRLQTANYLKGKINIVLGTIVTFATLFAWLSFKQISLGAGKSLVGYDPFVVASGIGVTTIRICMFNVYRNIYFLRKYGVIDRLFATPISKSFVFFSIIIFNFVVNIGVCACLFGFSMIYSDVRLHIGNINWLMFISGFLLLSVFCFLFAFILGFGIGFTQKKFEIALIIASVFYFGSIYILGLGIPYSLVFNKDVSSLGFAKFIYWFDYFIPVKYQLNIMQAGWIGDTSFSYFSGTDLYWTSDGFGYNFQTWIPYVVSLFVCAVAGGGVAFIFIRRYEVGIKKYRRVLFTKLHAKNISTIRKAKTLEELEQEMLLVKVQRNNVTGLIKRGKGEKGNGKRRS